MQKILFVCTGNYYRSRFAEEYFNHLADNYNLNWHADSKGLSQNMPSLNNPGPISIHTLEALQAKGIKGKNLKRFPRPVKKQDFATNNRIIAMSEKEHRPMIESRFLGQADKIEYFEVGDLPVDTPELAILKITNLVEKLVAQIKCAEKKEGQFIDC